MPCMSAHLYLYIGHAVGDCGGHYERRVRVYAWASVPDDEPGPLSPTLRADFRAAALMEGWLFELQLEQRDGDPLDRTRLSTAKCAECDRTLPAELLRPVNEYGFVAPASTRVECGDCNADVGDELAAHALLLASKSKTAPAKSWAQQRSDAALQAITGAGEQ